MRALIGLLCLFSGDPAASVGGDADEARLARSAEVRAVLSEISARSPAPNDSIPHDLPDGLREAVEAWTDV